MLVVSLTSFIIIWHCHIPCWLPLQLSLRLYFFGFPIISLLPIPWRAEEGQASVFDWFNLSIFFWKGNEFNSSDLRFSFTSMISYYVNSCFCTILLVLPYREFIIVSSRKMQREGWRDNDFYCCLQLDTITDSNFIHYPSSLTCFDTTLLTPL